MQNVIAAVSLEAIAHNARLLARTARRPLIAVVKDDAYGHGAERVAGALHGIASAFAVATVEEGVSLRVAGTEEEILVLTPPLDGDDAARIAAYSLTASVTSLTVLRLLKNAQWGGKIRAHIAVNTGMNRYGVRPERAGHLAREARQAGIAVTGVYSHLYLPQSDAARRRQRALFVRAAEEVRAVFPSAVRHLSATGGLLAGECFDAVRTGIGLYGYLPAGFSGRLALRPAMRLYARVAHAAKFTGGGVGYAKAHKRYSNLYTLRLGYGDGFFRSGGLGNIGKLCMDACIMEGRARFGAWKRVPVGITEYAARHGTTEYEVLVNVARKAVKIYV